MNPDENITSILKENEIEDLKRCLEKRRLLNSVNTYLVYAFHICQTSGVILTALAVHSEDKHILSYIGIGLNAVASLINVIEKTNSNLSEKMLRDIRDIKNGTYVDEDTVNDVEEKENS